MNFFTCTRNKVVFDLAKFKKYVKANWNDRKFSNEELTDIADAFADSITSYELEDLVKECVYSIIGYDY